MKLYVLLPALVAAGFLSACGSTSSTPLSQFDSAVGFVEAVESGDVQPVNVEDLPDNATMNGYIAASQNLENGNVVYIGDATADFNFASGAILGSASNFNEYEVTDVACEDEVCAAPTADLTRALGGSLVITGNIDGTDFDYLASGVLTSEDEELGALSADVNLYGDGGIFTVDDKLTAFGEGGGYADVYGEEVYFGGSYLDSILVLQE